MNWIILIALMVIHAWIGGRIESHYQDASWHWAAVLGAVTITGWAFISVNSGSEVVLWLSWTVFWSWRLRARIKSLRQTSERSQL